MLRNRSIPLNLFTAKIVTTCSHQRLPPLKNIKYKYCQEHVVIKRKPPIPLYFMQDLKEHPMNHCCLR